MLWNLPVDSRMFLNVPKYFICKTIIEEEKVLEFQFLKYKKRVKKYLKIKLSIQIKTTLCASIMSFSMTRQSYHSIVFFMLSDKI